MVAISLQEYNTQRLRALCSTFGYVIMGSSYNVSQDVTDLFVRKFSPTVAAKTVRIAIPNYMPWDDILALVTVRLKIEC